MIGNNKVLAITLARGGSQSIPKKNIYQLNGKPLINYTIEEARKSVYIDDYWISSDSDEILNTARKSGIVKLVKRPTELAGSKTPSSEALIHAINEIEKRTDTCYDYIVELMVTNPLKTVDDIDSCINKMYLAQCESLVSVVRVQDHHPARIKYIEKGVLKDFYPEEVESRRQDLKPEAYIRNGSIYCMTHDFIMKNKARYGKETVAYIMPSERSINIDEMNDLLLAELLIKQRDNL